jgi:hypothetical protein
MQATYLWNQFHLYWRKIILLALFSLIFIFPSFSQSRFNAIHSSGQDDKLISYGFFLSGHTSTFKVRYSQKFLDQDYPITSVMPRLTQGFSLGFLGVLNLHDQFSFNFTPKVGFYSYSTDIFTSDNIVNPINNSPSIDTAGPFNATTEANMIEFPLFFKYKSQRFNNNRMFVTAGATPMFRTQSQDQANLDDLVITSQDITLDVSMGFDLYFKYFKFSPEIKFSHGLNNVYYLQESNPLWRDAISDIRRKTISIVFNFQ